MSCGTACPTRLKKIKVRKIKVSSTQALSFCPSKGERNGYIAVGDQRCDRGVVGVLVLRVNLNLEAKKLTRTYRDTKGGIEGGSMEPSQRIFVPLRHSGINLH